MIFKFSSIKTRILMTGYKLTIKRDEIIYIKNKALHSNIVKGFLYIILVLPVQLHSLF